MSNDGLQITGLQFLEEGVEISYIRVPGDVRKNGLVWSHAVLVPFASDYDEELEEFETALKDLLRDALDDEDRADPIDLTEPDDEDEDEDE